ncbi:hypothetical protein EGW08_021818 [Elysia chlorotica]|uniref:Uncharacterized protein n=1 Tax=Elysia chlorotica TaxID=188477 RepID=A0A433SMK3_ELYCH|nr:hypothetical protein EGW08_021818 [Elysia chlorotica]
MQGDSKTATCCQQYQAHSGQMFDWWRHSQDGRIVHTPEVAPPPPPFRPPPLRRDQLCWPMYQVSQFEGLGQEMAANTPTADPEHCEPSKDYWPDTETICVQQCYRKEHVRPPWIPPKNPKNTPCCGSAIPRPHSYTCAGRQKPVQPYLCRP